MESKNFAEKFLNLKKEILGEIRALVPENSTHRFKEKFFVHYIDGEVATTEICSAVEHWLDGTIALIVHEENKEEEGVIESETTLLNFEPNTFIDILDNLKKDFREEKLLRLKELINNADDDLYFDGEFVFTGWDEEKWAVPGCELTSLRISDGEIIIGNNHEGDVFENGDSFLGDEDIDKLIAYVEKKTRKKYTVQVSGSFSRMWEIEASNYKEAIAKAKEDWLINPLIDEDVNGEDWRSWQE